MELKNIEYNRCRIFWWNMSPQDYSGYDSQYHWVENDFFSSRLWTSSWGNLTDTGNLARPPLSAIGARRKQKYPLQSPRAQIYARATLGFSLAFRGGEIVLLRIFRAKIHNFSQLPIMAGDFFIFVLSVVNNRLRKWFSKKGKNRKMKCKPT